MVSGVLFLTEDFNDLLPFMHDRVQILLPLLVFKVRVTSFLQLHNGAKQGATGQREQRRRLGGSYYDSHSWFLKI
ncbi:protein of unknown function (plasmid) [Paraburkholderia dioscoreae]|uniref:Uncharacterized protein n=1 Tax=Paraburkholderia dioscoreae TaxID=2604047 RepID=A0A5Q4ZII9_9BURK|nr:protein of unknown function [Paraburkholderia dioscoreae]